jgi:hypothetical protein
MMYSVWNNARRAYDYYRGPATSATHAGAPPVTRGASELGATPDQAAWPLPAGAVKVGSGEFPQGKIASLGAADGGPNLILYAALALLAYRMFR